MGPLMTQWVSSSWYHSTKVCLISVTRYVHCVLWLMRLKTGLILGLRPANERRRYKVAPPLIGWAQISNQTETIWWQLSQFGPTDWRIFDASSTKILRLQHVLVFFDLGWDPGFRLVDSQSMFWCVLKKIWVRKGSLVCSFLVQGICYHRNDLGVWDG